MRSRILKIVFLVLLAFSLFVAAVLMAVPWFLSIDAIRIRLAQEFSAWAGYSVQLRETPQISFFPQFKATFPGVVLHAHDEGQEPFMEAERIEFNLSLFAALRGKISISETYIIAPKFTLTEPIKNINQALQNLSGSQGTLGIFIREALMTAEKTPNAPDLKRLYKQPFGRIVVKDGVINYRSFTALPQDKVAQETVAYVNATLNWPASSGKVSLVISGNWREELTELRVEAEQALLLFSHRQSPVKISINSRKGGITFIGQARFDDRFFFDGKLMGRSPRWDQTLKWLGLKHTLGTGLKVPVVWESALNAVPERIVLDVVNLSLGDDNARGALEISDFGEIPLISGSLAFQSLNLDQMLEAYLLDDLGSGKFDFDQLEQVNFDIRLSSPKVQFSSLNLTNLAAALQVSNGRAIFDLGNINAFDGILQSNIQIFHENEMPRIEGRLSGSGIESSAVLKTMKYPPVLNAKSSFSLTFHAPFANWAEAISAMKGNFIFESGQSRFTGYSFSNLEQRLLIQNPVVLVKEDNQFYAFNRLLAKGSFSYVNAQITDGLLVVGDQKNVFSGLIPFSGMRDELDLLDSSKGGYDVVFNVSQTPIGSLTMICADIECLQNSIMPPKLFFLLGNQEHLKIRSTLKNETQE